MDTLDIKNIEASQISDDENKIKKFINYSKKYNLKFLPHNVSNSIYIDDALSINFINPIQYNKLKLL
jgi:hypothetical protein